MDYLRSKLSPVSTITPPVENDLGAVKKTSPDATEVNKSSPDIGVNTKIQDDTQIKKLSPETPKTKKFPAEGKQIFKNANEIVNDLQIETVPYQKVVRIHFILLVMLGFVMQITEDFIQSKLRIRNNEFTFHGMHCFLVTDFIAGVCGFFLGEVADSYTGRYVIALGSFCMYALQLIVDYSIVLLTYFDHIQLHILAEAYVFSKKVAKGVLIAFFMDQIPLPKYAAFVDIHSTLIVFSLHFGVITAASCEMLLIFLKIHFIMFLTELGIAIAIIMCIILFVLKYKVVREPAEFGLGRSILICICYALFKKLSNRIKTEKRKHWIDWAEGQYSQNLLSLIKKTFKITIVIIPFIFHTSINVLLERIWLQQIKYVSSPLIYLNFDEIIPIIGFTAFVITHFIVKPLLKKCKLAPTDVKALVIGYLLIGLSLVITSIAQVPIDMRMQQFPTIGFGQVKYFNVLKSSTVVRSRWSGYQELTPLKMLHLVLIPVSNNISMDKLEVRNTMEGISQNLIVVAIEGKSVNYVVTNNGLLKIKGTDSIIPIYSEYEVLCYIINTAPALDVVILIRWKNNVTSKYTVPYTSTSTPVLLRVGSCEVSIFSLKTNTTQFSQHFYFGAGGIYAFLVYGNTNSTFQIYTLVKPNWFPVHLLYPQIIFRLVGDVLILPALISFIYLRSPPTLRGTIYSFVLLSECVGSGIVYFVTAAANYEINVTLINIWTTVFFMLYFTFLYCTCRYNV